MSTKRNYLWAALGIIVIAALLLSGCGPKTPKNALERVKQSGVLRVAISADYPPYTYIDAAGNFTGYSIEVDKELAKRLGVKLELTDVPFDSIFTGLAQGKYDVADGAHIWEEEREKVMDFPQPYFIDQYALMVAADFDESKIQKVEDIGKFKAGTLTGGAEEIWFTDKLVKPGLLPAENLIFYDRNDSVALDIAAHRIDLTLNKMTVLAAFVKEIGGLKVLRIEGLPTDEGVYMSVNEGETELKDAIDAVFTKLNEEGFFHDLAVKYEMAVE